MRLSAVSPPKSFMHQQAELLSVAVLLASSAFCSPLRGNVQSRPKVGRNSWIPAALKQRILKQHEDECVSGFVSNEPNFGGDSTYHVFVDSAVTHGKRSLNFRFHLKMKMSDFDFLNGILDFFVWSIMQCISAFDFRHLISVSLILLFIFLP